MANISVQFYNNLSDNRCMEKTLTPIGEPVLCDIYSLTDVIDPVLVVDMDKVDITNCNYCIIAGFNRNYFITSIVPTSAKSCEVTCHVDVLTTYKEDIRNCPLIAARSTNLPNYYLHDDLRIFNTYSINQYIDVKGGDVANGDIGAPSTLILMTLGAGES